MKVVILAAGVGTRFGLNTPKPLTKLTRTKTILDFQIKKLEKYVGIRNIILVVGYKKDMFTKHFPNLKFIVNKNFQTTNTSKSALLGLKKINEDVLIVDGDLFFDEQVLDLICTSKSSCCLVDKNNFLNHPTKCNFYKNGYIKEISKSIKDPPAQLLGVRLIRKKDLKIFKEALDLADDSAYQDSILSKLTMERQIKLKPIDINGYFCYGINTNDDFKIVKNYYLKSTRKSS